MNKNIFSHIKALEVVVFFLLFNTMTVLAQKNLVIIDTAFLKCEYKTLYYTDTLKFKDAIWMPDEFILQVGTCTSKYYSKKKDDYERMRSDPDALAAYDKLLRLPKGERPNLSTLPARYGALVIYNNYPEGKSTIHDAVFMDYYIFEDDNLPQQWTIISDSVKTILGYTCQKATCSYRGRNYEAWYNPDLPVNAGPWKFSGLPGLIMSVQDTKGHYTFEIKGLMKVKEPIEYIEYSNRKYSHSDRKTFLKTNAKSLQIGIVRYLEANAPKGSSSSDFKQTGGGAKYDLLERDY